MFSLKSKGIQVFSEVGLLNDIHCHSLRNSVKSIIKTQIRPDKQTQPSKESVVHLTGNLVFKLFIMLYVTCCIDMYIHIYSLWSFCLVFFFLLIKRINLKRLVVVAIISCTVHITTTLLASSKKWITIKWCSFQKRRWVFMWLLHYMFLVMVATTFSVIYDKV